MPRSIEAHVRWMGLYHSPFNDLPLSVCRDQLRVWDRPPVSASRARVWIQIGGAIGALRARDFAGAARHIEHARTTVAGLPAAYDAARIEIALVDSYIASRTAGERQDRLLDEAETLLKRARTIDAGDRRCFEARLVDQRAFELNRRATSEGDRAALAAYEALPQDDVHPFASYRRDAGLAYGYLRAGDIERALACAERACHHAGDGGYVRLRTMGLLMQVKILGVSRAAEQLARAKAIAERLEDEELLGRVTRAAKRP